MDPPIVWTNLWAARTTVTAGQNFISVSSYHHSCQNVVYCTTTTTIYQGECDIDSHRWGWGNKEYLGTLAAANGSLYSITFRAPHRVLIKFNPVNKSMTYIRHDFGDDLKWCRFAMTDAGIRVDWYLNAGVAFRNLQLTLHCCIDLINLHFRWLHLLVDFPISKCGIDEWIVNKSNQSISPPQNCLLWFCCPVDFFVSANAISCIHEWSQKLVTPKNLWPLLSCYAIFIDKDIIRHADETFRQDTMQTR